MKFTLKDQNVRKQVCLCNKSMHINVVIGLISIALLCPAQTQDQNLGQDWSQFRGPDGLANSAVSLPLTWSVTENIIWKKELPGPGTSSPIIVGERIFLTCYTGYGPGIPGENSQSKLQLHLLCISKNGNQILWNKAISPELPEQERIREDHGYASSTPVADQEGVYVFFGKTGVIAFNNDGIERWRTRVGSNINGWGSAASPILYKNLVIVNASVESGCLIGLEKATGKEKWRATGIKEAWNTPHIVSVSGGKKELIVPIIGKVLAFNPDNGQQLWHCDTGIAWYMCPSVVSHDGIVYVIGGRSGGSLAIKAGGTGNVTSSHIVWRLPKGSNVSSPVYHADHLYFAHENLGMVYCINAKTGQIVYEERLNPNSGMIYPSPIIAGDKLYYISRSGNAFVLPAKPQFQVLAHNNLRDGSPFNASPAVSGNQLLLRSNKYLYCIGKK